MRYSFLKRLALIAASTILCAATSRANAQHIVVVVNEDNPITTITPAKLSDIFLKKVTRWDSKRSIVPVNQPDTASTREIFSKWIHDRSTAAVERFWQMQIFSGKDVPPTTKAGDAAVLAFVRGNPNAVGYVSAEATLGTGVKVIAKSPGKSASK